MTEAQHIVIIQLLVRLIVLLQISVHRQMKSTITFCPDPGPVAITQQSLYTFSLYRLIDFLNRLYIILLVLNRVTDIKSLFGSNPHTSDSILRQSIYIFQPRHLITQPFQRERFIILIFKHIHSVITCPQP